MKDSAEIAARIRALAERTVECDCQPKGIRCDRCHGHLGGSGQVPLFPSLVVPCPYCDYPARPCAAYHGCSGTGQVVTTDNLVERLLEAFVAKGLRIALINHAKGHWGVYGGPQIVWDNEPLLALLSALEAVVA